MIGRLATALALMVLSSTPGITRDSEVAAQAPQPPATAPTWTKDVAPIYYRACVSCHRPGDVGPFSLMTFGEARAVAKITRPAVADRIMPPWDGVKGVGEFSNDPSLTDQEIKTILDWIDAGTPAGSGRDLPRMPSFPPVWKMGAGNPDVVFNVPPSRNMPAEFPRFVQEFKVPTNFLEDRDIEVAEVVPSRFDLVHHAIVTIDGSTGPQIVASYLPGGQIHKLPEGVIKRIPKGAVLNVSIQYRPIGEATIDRNTKIGFRFAKKPGGKVALTGLSSNRTFDIPPGDANYEAKGESFTFAEDSHIVTLLPRMNGRGKDVTYTLVLPDGTRRDLLKLFMWEDDWEPSYHLKTPIAAPKGSRLEVVVHFDNSAANENNPDPKKRVRYGEETMDAFFEYTVDAERP